MNEEFEKRSNAVFEALGVLVSAAPGLVFLGGSAIQALLQTPKRLSIDLDVSYSGNVERLISELKNKGFAVSQRISRNPDFLFYTILKNGVMVKLDISKLGILETEKHKINNFEVSIPKKSYFLAAKLSSLALGTIGRLEMEQSQIIKDIFDINCLLDLEIDLRDMGKDWRQIISAQNKLRKTNFKEAECIKSVEKTLLKCIDVAPLPDFFISQNALGGFQDTLVNSTISRRDLATMAARALLLSSYMDDEFYKAEKTAANGAKSAEALEKVAKTRTSRGVLAQKQIAAIKIIAPNALMLLEQYEKKERIKPPK